MSTPSSAPEAAPADSPGTPEPESKLDPAWHPLTPVGVAAFADSRYGRLLLVQSISAILITLVLVWFLYSKWFSVVEDAIARLPETGEIAGGTLQLNGASPQRLAQNGFLGIGVDLEHSGDIRSPDHLFLEFGRAECQVYSILGYRPLYYPPLATVPFNRPELQPWLGAWQPALIAIGTGAIFLLLLSAWSGFATVYGPVLWLVAFFTDRDLGFFGAWKCAGAAMIPGGLFLAACIAAYALALLDLPQLLLACAIHFVLPWCYLALALAVRPRLADARARRNPFQPQKPK